MNDPLPCDKEVEIFIDYTVMEEKQGSVPVMFLVSGDQRCRVMLNTITFHNNFHKFL